MKIVPNTDSRIHVLACDFYAPDDDVEITYRELPVVAWEIAWFDDDGQIMTPRPITIGGYLPGDVNETDAFVSLLYYPHEGKYGGEEPFQVDPMDRDQAEIYLAKACRRRFEDHARRI